MKFVSEVTIENDNCEQMFHAKYEVSKPIELISQLREGIPAIANAVKGVLEEISTLQDELN